MTPELQKYYETYFDLFSSEGWKQFISDTEDNRTLVSDIRTVKDEKDLNYRKGVLDTLDRLINFSDTIENAYKEAQETE